MRLYKIWKFLVSKRLMIKFEFYGQSTADFLIILNFIKTLKNHEQCYWKISLIFKNFHNSYDKNKKKSSCHEMAITSWKAVEY